ncbi:MAG: amidohydrolase [Flavobacteriaceae bacterium]|nr:amidohydrolase [Flavobacteriaceae bacterium]
MPEQPKRESHGNQFNSNKRGPYSWNEAIRPETDAAGIFHTNETEAEALRNLGFGMVLSHNMDGIARGTGALVSLATGRDNKMLLRSKVSQHFSFNRGSSPQDYPRSLMGSIALLRQTFYDARWYAQATTKETDLSIEALLSAKTLPAFFEANDKWNTLRAAKVGTEFGQKFIIKGGGDEYQRLDELKKTGMPVVLPLNFPAPFDLTDSMMSRYINLTQLMHWEQAPSNPARVAAANIPFALTAFGLESKADFYKKLTKAWQYGLGTKDILKALTTTPAQWLGLDKQYGALKAGMAANFFISTDSLMGEEFFISENWLMGEKYINTEKPKVDLTNLNGVYLVEGKKCLLLKKQIELRLDIMTDDYPNVNLVYNQGVYSVNGKFSDFPNFKIDSANGLFKVYSQLNYPPVLPFSNYWLKLRDLKPSDTLPNPDLKDLNGVYKIDNHPKWTVSISGAPKQLKAIYNTGNVMGDASPQFFKDSLMLVLQETDNDPWSVMEILYKIDTLSDKSIQMKGLTKIRNLNGKDVAIQIRWEYGNSPKKPFVEYGSWWEKPNEKITLITNATIWSNESEYGVWKTNLAIQNGKIKDIGDNLSLKYPNAKIIDATSLHLTPGIIDEHSHIACTGDVNEGTQSVTSEVRIGDIINPEDINIYRQLSGGVTTSHILHGSANAIGGQTQLIKLRWGKSAEEMKVEGWEGFIKFALGENVKQSNWGDRSNVRYPQTRMGVEQTMLDAFVRAQEYQKAWSNFEQLQTKNPKLKTAPPRRDLELDALVEILENRRHITCHSYVQSEINMLMHLADSMGFKVNTFTHILEGYKVADKMKAHGAAGSTFADWWAYKHEVMEAIPYNAFIMNKMGINTCVNSDDAEMARRLNQEAAKSMKYGGMSDTEAIKMCTINPAKMLHIDKQTGSIKEGKDADLVIWNGNPLSIYSKVLMTFVDGQLLYDASQQEYLQQQMKADRNRILKQMKEAIKNGEKPVTAETPKKEEYGCGH